MSPKPQEDMRSDTPKHSQNASLELVKRKKNVLKREREKGQGRGKGRKAR